MSLLARRIMLGCATEVAGGGDPPPMDVSGLRAWYKADALTGLVGGDAVATWTDSSGNGHHATQSVANNRPLYIPNVLNGLPVLRFDGNIDYFNVPLAAFSGLTAAEAFVVVKADADPPASGWVSGLWSMSGNVNLTHYPFSDGTIYDEFFTSARKTVGNPTPSLASWRLYNVSSGAGVWTSRLDGTQLFTTGTNTVAVPAVEANLGRALGSSSQVANFDGDIAEFILYGSVLSSGDRDAIESYIADKYALTIA